ncbi:MAG TPA: RIP metalloprotease RseP [Candidatus Sulfotelmatobacter sp.]|nr:RIP metalloprotease RseP [Candidatus Sulfotelmatobacter sp.]
MQSFPTTIVAFIFVLGVLVFVHEFGHYAVAKLFKVRVEVFSLGFGKRLIGFRRGDTDYRISLLPLGGYVKMAGENPMESRTGDPGEFMSHPRWQRFLIAIAGPAMNIILAVVVLTGVYMYRHEYPAYFDKPAELGWVMEGSLAQKAGLKAGDRISSIQGKSNPTWDDARYQIFANINQNLEMDVQRGEQTLHFNLPARVSEKEEGDVLGDLGMVPAGAAIVDKVEAGKPADKAGMRRGDEIRAVNDISVQSGNAVGLFAVLQTTKDKPVKINVVRNGEAKDLTVTPQLMPGRPGSTEAYRIGIEIPTEFHTDKLSFTAAVHAASVECKKNSTLIFRLLGQLVSGKGSIKQFGGPVMIAEESGRAAQLGFVVLLQFMTLISLNLAIFNLLPIPILDGGLMLMLLVEGIMRRDIKQQIKERVYQAAFVFLVLFAAVVIYNDIAKNISGSRTAQHERK